jgi:hypothetical protein
MHRGAQPYFTHSIQRRAGILSQLSARNGIVKQIAGINRIISHIFGISSSGPNALAGNKKS